MKCGYCGTEMLVDRVEEEGNTQKFFYKCPNPACPRYGYGEKTTVSENGESDAGTRTEAERR